MRLLILDMQGASCYFIIKNPQLDCTLAKEQTCLKCMCTIQPQVHSHLNDYARLFGIPEINLKE